MLLPWTKRQQFGPYCPSGGTWYACGYGSYFSGCCTSDPCTKGCSQGNIRPVGFNAAYYGQLPDVSCGTSAKFYTCAGGSATFWGCCESDPCSQGLQCPDGDLVPAFLDRPKQMSAYSPTGGRSSTSAVRTSKRGAPYASFDPSGISLSPTSSATSTSFSPSHTIAALPATMTAAAGQANSSHKESLIAPIAGGVSAGVLIFAVGLFIYFILHAKKSRSQHRESLEQRQTDLTEGVSKRQHSIGGPFFPEAPPEYSNSHSRPYPYYPDSGCSYAYRQTLAEQFELPAILRPGAQDPHAR